MKIKKITRIKNNRLTLDLEVNGSHTYQLANGCVTHNTASLVLSTSSGIHAWHDAFYIRRIRIKKTDALYNYFKFHAPDFVKDEIYNPEGAILEFPLKAPENAIVRNKEEVMELLERIKKFNIEWVRNGHNYGDNYNNVSATVSIKKSPIELFPEKLKEYLDKNWPFKSYCIKNGITFEYLNTLFNKYNVGDNTLFSKLYNIGISQEYWESDNEMVFKNLKEIQKMWIHLQSLNEWPSVGNWMFTNKDSYNGLSVLPYDGGTYIQAPFESITEDEYNAIIHKFPNDIDLSEIIETEDLTELKGAVACAGGACDILV